MEIKQCREKNGTKGDQQYIRERQTESIYLHDFQKLHFELGVDADFSAQQPDVLLEKPELTEDVDQGSLDDDLGCYSDGVKRTLTDEQISMFRHSEVYSILRKRQLQKENQPPFEELNPPASVSVDVACKNYEPGQNASKSGNVSLRRQGSSIANASVRKQNHVSNNKNKGQFLNTPGRQAREADDMPGDVGFLDYGEDSGTGLQDIRHGMPDAGDQIDLNHPDDDSMEGSRLRSHEQGKRIWWPTIG
ncbi:MAG: hypothetical protein Q9220_007528 [cf. Caloplaca sp. 1 TL-2023]